MNSFLTGLTLLVMGLVAIVLIRRRCSTWPGAGSGNTSNKLMQAPCAVPGHRHSC